jgi:hypothetical protein
MRSLRYLNTILTVITVLLAMHLWTWWSDGPLPAAAVAAPRSVPTPGGIPNAGAQRQQQIDLLKLLNQRTDDLVNLLRSGQARVRVDVPREPAQLPAEPR